MTRLLLKSHTALHHPFAMIFLLFALAACSSPPPATNVQLHSLFTDHMVLQRDQVITLWGWAEPGGVVSAAIAGQEASARVRSDSSWRLLLLVHWLPVDRTSFMSWERTRYSSLTSWLVKYGSRPVSPIWSGPSPAP